MTKTIENLFVYCAIYSSLIPAILFLAFFKKAKNSILITVVSVYVLVEFVTNVVTAFLPLSVVKVLYSGFTIVEYLLFAICFYLLIKSSLIKKGIVVLSSLFFVFAIFYFIFTKYKTLDSIPIGIETLLILTYAFYYLYEEMNNPSQILIYNKYSFWIVGGIMIYLAGSFFIYVFANQVDAKTFRQYWMFTNIFTILKNIFFSISILVFLKLSKEVRVKNLFY
ncbi:MAG: hypothetical protein JWP88_676 [Flaviaesturariibacter sp.]|nr:hypothetical protein [Flaviaesturariibacter sp.]